MFVHIQQHYKQFRNLMHVIRTCTNIFDLIFFPLSLARSLKIFVAYLVIKNQLSKKNHYFKSIRFNSNDIPMLHVKLLVNLNIWTKIRF